MKRLFKRLRPLAVPALALLAAALVARVWLLVAWVPSASMDPTIPPHALVLGRRGGMAQGPTAGDIIFFRHRELGDLLLVKRVIATQGQTVELRAGRVYLDGRLLEEDYVAAFSSEDFGPLTVPARCCFVLGDDRTASLDARSWQDPFVPYTDIVGTALWLCFPRIERLGTSA